MREQGKADHRLLLRRQVGRQVAGRFMRQPSPARRLPRACCARCCSLCAPSTACAAPPRRWASSSRRAASSPRCWFSRSMWANLGGWVEAGGGRGRLKGELSLDSRREQQAGRLGWAPARRHPPGSVVREQHGAGPAHGPALCVRLQLARGAGVQAQRLAHQLALQRPRGGAAWWVDGWVGGRSREGGREALCWRQRPLEGRCSP